MTGKAPQPLVLYGGSFDPVHKAHLACAQAAAEALGLPVTFLPTAGNPLKARTGARDEDRLAMLNLAIEDDPRLQLSEWEISQPPPSYTHATLVHFRRQLGGQPLILVIGADSLAGMPQWRNWQIFRRLCHLVVLPRPKAPAPPPMITTAFPEGDAEQLLSQPAGLRLMLEQPRLDISSTQIRDNVDAASILPVKVAAYIRENGLYR